MYIFVWVCTCKFRCAQTKKKKKSELSILNMQDLKDNLEVWIFACGGDRLALMIIQIEKDLIV